MKKQDKINSYKVKYIKHGKYEELIFTQGYNAINNVYMPYFIRVYDLNKDCILSGFGASIEDSYNSLIRSLIIYVDDIKRERAELRTKLKSIYNLIKPENDDRF